MICLVSVEPAHIRFKIFELVVNISNFSLHKNENFWLLTVLPGNIGKQPGHVGQPSPGPLASLPLMMKVNYVCHGTRALFSCSRIKRKVKSILCSFESEKIRDRLRSHVFKKSDLLPYFSNVCQGTLAFVFAACVLISDCLSIMQSKKTGEIQLETMLLQLAIKLSY